MVEKVELNLFVNDPVQVQLVGKSGSKQDGENVGDAVRELERLQSLLASGAIDQREFEGLKNGIVQRVL